MDSTNPHRPTTTQDSNSIHSTSSESNKTPENTHENTTLIRAFSNPARLPAASLFSRPLFQGHRTRPRNTNHPTQTHDNGRDEPVTSTPPYSVNRPPGDLRYVWLSNAEGVNFAPGGSNYRPVVARNVQSLRRPVSAPPHLPPSYTVGEGAPYSVAAREKEEVDGDVDSQVLLTRRRDRVRRLGQRLAVKAKILTKRKPEDDGNGEGRLGA